MADQIRRATPAGRAATLEHTIQAIRRHNLRVHRTDDPGFECACSSHRVQSPYSGVWHECWCVRDGDHYELGSLMDRAGVPDTARGEGADQAFVGSETP